MSIRDPQFEPNWEDPEEYEMPTELKFQMLINILSYGSNFSVCPQDEDGAIRFNYRDDDGNIATIRVDCPNKNSYTIKAKNKILTFSLPDTMEKVYADLAFALGKQCDTELILDRLLSHHQTESF